MKLFWKELKQPDSPRKCLFGYGTVWASLDKVTVDTAKLEHLFESKAKELPVAKVSILLAPVAHIMLFKTALAEQLFGVVVDIILQSVFLFMLA